MAGKVRRHARWTCYWRLVLSHLSHNAWRVMSVLSICPWNVFDMQNGSAVSNPTGMKRLSRTKNASIPLTIESSSREKAFGAQRVWMVSERLHDSRSHSYTVVIDRYTTQIIQSLVMNFEIIIVDQLLARATPCKIMYKTTASVAVAVFLLDSCF